MRILEVDFLLIKVTQTMPSTPPLPHISSLKHKHTRYLQLIGMIKTELKSPLLKLHLNVGTSWTVIFHSSQTQVSPCDNLNWWLTEWSDGKKSPPGLDGSMEKVMPHFSKWSNEFASNDRYTFSHSQNASLRPAHSSKTPFPPSSGKHPGRLSPIDCYCNIWKNECRVAFSCTIPAETKYLLKVRQPFPSPGRA